MRNSLSFFDNHSKFSVVRPTLIAVEPFVENLDPRPKDKRGFDSYARLIRQFQGKGLISHSTVVSLVHPGLYMVPSSWYQENKHTYAFQARREVETQCREQFDYSDISILVADEPSSQFLVEKLSAFAKKLQSDLLVVLSSNRSGLSYWFLGSFSETAALTAKVSVLVLKPQIKSSDFSKNVRMVVALDLDVTYSTREITKIIDWAKKAKSHVDLIYAQRKSTVLSPSLRSSNKQRDAENKLNKIASYFKKANVRTSVVVIDKENSTAEAIVKYADSRKAWMILTISTERAFSRKLLLGSTARRILSLTKRPFLSLQLEKN